MSTSASALRAFRIYTDAERQTSLQQTLQHWNAQEDVWVFAYGSLIWRPEFTFVEQRLAVVRGYHRALCLWSRVNRGTPQKPGLVFGLDTGGSCRGVAFRIPAADVLASLTALWRREMISGEYLPKWLNVCTGAGRVRALAFVMDRHSDGYVCDLPEERLLDVVRSACGSYGPCKEYVVETARALRASGIIDAKLETLVQRLQGEAGGCAQTVDPWQDHGGDARAA